MFEAGFGTNPANKWSKIISTFFKEHDMIVKSHDFRVTQVTAYYNETLDIIKTQEFVGHSKIETTRKYVKMARKNFDKTTHEFLNRKRPTKRQKTSK